MITHEELKEMFGDMIPIEAATVLTTGASEEEIRAKLAALAPKKAKSLLYAHILLDRSGSMESIRDTTIDAFNEYVNGLAKNPDIDSRVSLTLFDGVSIDLVIDSMMAGRCPRLNRETFIPRGNTPLNDAIGKTVVKIDGTTLRDSERVAMVILTDGQENASTEYTKSSVKALLDGRQRDKNWLVLFLGANIDVFTEGVGRGTTTGHSLNFAARNVGAAMNSANRATASYAISGQSMHADFTAEERLSAIEEKAKKGTGDGKVA